MRCAFCGRGGGGGGIARFEIDGFYAYHVRGEEDASGAKDETHGNVGEDAANAVVERHLDCY